jgi:hypothetical protein
LPIKTWVDKRADAALAISVMLIPIGLGVDTTDALVFIKTWVDTTR